MTFPIVTVRQLRGAIHCVPEATPLSVRDEHGNQLELAGVEPQLNEAEEIIGFVLIVGPKEEKT